LAPNFACPPRLLLFSSSSLVVSLFFSLFCTVNPNISGDSLAKFAIFVCTRRLPPPNPPSPPPNDEFDDEFPKVVVIEKKTNAKRERIIIAPMRLNDDLLVAVVAFEPFSDPIVASVIHCCTYDDDY
jgi:hypothetical protein